MTTPMTPPPPATRRGPGGSAFTLVELLIAMALTMILVGIMSTVFSNVQHIFQVTDQRLRNFSSARFAMDLIEQDLASIIATAQGDVGLLLQSDTYEPVAGLDPPVQFRRDRIRFITTHRSGLQQSPQFVMVDYRLEGNPPNPIVLRRGRLRPIEVETSDGGQRFVRPTADDDFRNVLWEIDEIGDSVAEFRIEYLAPPVGGDVNAPAEFLQPTLASAAEPGTDDGAFFSYLGINEQDELLGSLKDGKLRVPLSAGLGRNTFDMLQPGDQIELKETIFEGSPARFANGLFTILEKKKDEDELKVSFLESLGDESTDFESPKGVNFTAHALPQAIRITIATTDRDTPHGTISRVFRLR